MVSAPFSMHRGTRSAKPPLCPQMLDLAPDLLPRAETNSENMPAEPTSSYLCLYSSQFLSSSTLDFAVYFSAQTSVTWKSLFSWALLCQQQ